MHACMHAAMQIIGRISYYRNCSMYNRAHLRGANYRQVPLAAKNHTFFSVHEKLPKDSSHQLQLTPTPPIQPKQVQKDSAQCQHEDIKVGDLFSSYKELQTKLKLYESSNHVQLSHRDSRTIKGAKKRIKRVQGANEDLVYYSIHMVCIFGGKKYKNMGTGQRAYQRYWKHFPLPFILWQVIFLLVCSTIKQGCTAGIKLILSGDRQCLIVTSVCSDHNHCINRV